jgi:hypothetical protein
MGWRRAALGGLVALGLAILAGCGGGSAHPAPTTARPGSASELPGPDPLVRELIGFKVRYKDLLRRNVQLVRTVTVPYTAWNGAPSTAVLVLPNWYGPKTHPAIPLVISPHGRGGTAQGGSNPFPLTPWG